MELYIHMAVEEWIKFGLKKSLHTPHRPAFLELLRTFLKILAKYMGFWGAESKIELSFSLSRTISPKPALSIISVMCTLG
jgi:hypothetical protein